MLLSRVADALYWMSRYLERAEHGARLMDVCLDMGLDRSRPDTPAALLQTAVLDPAQPNSVAACLVAARENARQVREELSADMWEQVNGVYLRVKQLSGGGAARPQVLCRMVIEGVHLFQGITDATMGHGEGWQYLQAGRFLERAIATASLIDQRLGASGRPMADPAQHAEWVGLLRSCSALEAYCRVYTADLRPERIAEFLLLNHDFPRSVRFAARRVESALRAIATTTGRAENNRALRLAGRLHALLDYGQVDEILSDDPHAYLEGIKRHCAQVHGALYQTYISYPIESALIA
jgi:uncharacterized alpha-E superfamily protein